MNERFLTICEAWWQSRPPLDRNLLKLSQRKYWARAIPDRQHSLCNDGSHIFPSTKDSMLVMVLFRFYDRQKSHALHFCTKILYYKDLELTASKSSFGFFLHFAFEALRLISINGAGLSALFFNRSLFNFVFFFSIQQPTIATGLTETVLSTKPFRFRSVSLLPFIWDNENEYQAMYSCSWQQTCRHRET